MAAKEEKKEKEAALAKAREASEKAKEEAAQLRERTALAEETASKAREEATHYKDAAAELDKENSLVKSDLASSQEAYSELKEECVKSKIARSAAEEAGKKAREDLEAERVRSCGLSDDVDRRKRMLLENEGAVLQAGKMIEDLRATNTDLARSYKEIERASTDLVGENTALEERIRGLKDDLLAAQVDARSTKAQLDGEPKAISRS
ncbi:axoneme-associated protein mst101(3)-like [Sorghum bicolor]|uniref:axoneme-associated protein mst101(3)-like n=1 Tax=Sorghum bicolor TaxID=4558 RepID=UPI000B423DF8|nr:axoneme-associated protein mst101(3)-like [Sorghum bicolor]|eukprot:XP_021309108.1 axoneme-associated protein mst101(3)-like [Sorghum bicolor]